jgi:general secretion pathway protein G
MEIRNRNSGFTLIELILTVTIIAILVGMAVPLTRNTVKREREIELHQALHEMREAIDKYKEMADRGQIQITLNTEGYPAKLEDLVEGVPVVGGVDKKLKLLRRIPRDPMTNSTEWGMRSYQDDPKSMSWGGQNVFDVYTKSDGIGLDGTKYNEW